MYGYVLPDKPNMFIKDYTEYKAYYCGLCKSIGEKCNQFMRFTTSYDMTFLSALMHNLCGVQPVYKRQNCILHPLRKRDVVVSDSVTDTLVDVNAILVHYKAEDARADKDKGRIIGAVVSGRYKKAKNRFPGYDAKVGELFGKLRNMEREEIAIPEQLAEVFGEVLVATGEVFAPLDGDYEAVLFNLGKWVYLTDALDDFDEDVKAGRFNAFSCAYAECKSRSELVAEKSEDLQYLFGTIRKQIKDAYDNIYILYSEGLLTNTIYYGLSAMTAKIMWRTEKCKKTRF